MSTNLMEGIMSTYTIMSRDIVIHSFILEGGGGVAEGVYSSRPTDDKYVGTISSRSEICEPIWFQTACVWHGILLFLIRFRTCLFRFTAHLPTCMPIRRL